MKTSTNSETTALRVLVPSLWPHVENKIYKYHVSVRRGHIICGVPRQMCLSIRINLKFTNKIFRMCPTKAENSQAMAVTRSVRRKVSRSQVHLISMNSKLREESFEISQRPRTFPTYVSWESSIGTTRKQGAIFITSFYDFVKYLKTKTFCRWGNKFFILFTTDCFSMKEGDQQCSFHLFLSFKLLEIKLVNRFLTRDEATEKLIYNKPIHVMQCIAHPNPIILSEQILSLLVLFNRAKCTCNGSFLDKDVSWLYCRYFRNGYVTTNQSFVQLITYQLITQPSSH